MLPGGQIEVRLGLAKPEVKMVMIVGNWLIERRKVYIDQQVMVTGVGLINACWSNAGTAESHSDPEATLDHQSIRRPKYIDLGIRRHGGLLRNGTMACQQDAH